MSKEDIITKKVGIKSKLTYSDITMFLHCDKCLEELPEGTSPSEYADFEVGFAHNGKLLIWCRRHKAVAGEIAVKDPPPQNTPCPSCGQIHGPGSQEKLFNIGRMGTSKTISDYVAADKDRMEQFGNFFARHHHCDHGNISEEEIMSNFSAIMLKKGVVISRYDAPEFLGGKFIVLTKVAEEETLLIQESEYNEVMEKQANEKK